LVLVREKLKSRVSMFLGMRVSPGTFLVD